MPISSHWRSISVVLPLLLSAGALSAPAPVLARAPETAAVLETMDSGTVSRAAVEALLTRASTGDAEAAEVAGRLYDRGIGVKWDPPSALRWYAVAALAGSNSAKREAGRLWRVMPPVSQRRAEAVLAHFFTDAELAGINLGPVRRPTTQRSWMTNLEAAGFLAPPPPAPPWQLRLRSPDTGSRLRSRAGTGRRVPKPLDRPACLSDHGAAGSRRQRPRRLPWHSRQPRWQPPRKRSSLLRPGSRVRRTPSRLPRSCRSHILRPNLQRILRFHWRNRSVEPKTSTVRTRFP